MEKFHGYFFGQRGTLRLTTDPTGPCEKNRAHLYVKKKIGANTSGCGPPGIAVSADHIHAITK